MIRNNKLGLIVRICVLALLIFQAYSLAAPNSVKTVHAVEPVRVIFETDFTLDVDDVGALAILHAMADNGEAQILAESYDEVSVDAEDALDAINTWYGRGGIPIGLYDKSMTSPDFGPYILPLAGMAHNINDNTVGTSLSLYQSVLAAQPDNSVTIISVGFLNNLYDLLVANPTLVAQKVNKLVVMGGLNGDEFNFVRHGLVSQTEYVLQNWPNTVAVIEFGVNTQTGYALLNAPANNPIRQGYATWFGGQPQNRPSWDQVATLYAVRGLGSNFNEVTSGTGSLTNGYTWNLHGGANARTYITSKITDSQMATIISNLMVASPLIPPSGDPEVSGTIIGTSGSCCGHPKEEAFDGPTSTYFDAPSADGGWVGYDFGAGNEKVITTVGYYPRLGFLSRSNGGKFQGSNNASFSSPVTLYTIVGTPLATYTTIPINNSTAFRYVRYLAPTGGWGNIAELDFHGHANTAPTNTPVPPTNTPVPPTSTPVPTLLLRYDFTNGSGTTVTDISGNGKTGTLTDFTNTSAGYGSFNSSEGWVTGGGLNFLDNGVRNYVQTNLALNSLANSDFTIEYKASYAGAAGWTPAIGSNASSCCTATFFLGIADNLTNNNARLQASAFSIGTQPWGASSSIQHRVALVFTNSTKVVEIFVDGSSVGTATFSSANMNQTSTFRIGNTGHDTTEQWDGVIYAIAISKAKLGPGTFVLP